MAEDTIVDTHVQDVIEPTLANLIVTNYDGGFDDSGRYSGSGFAETDSGCEYEGEFANGLFHGTGRLSWKDGVVYEGA